MFKLLNRFKKNESGATAIEYGMICALMAVAVIAIMTVFGDKLETAFGTIGDGLQNKAAEIQ